jgi:hypothetical protein
MKKFILGITVGIFMSIALYFGVSFFSMNATAAQDVNLNKEDVSYSYVDFKYNDLVLYDIGIKVNNDLYVRPEKLMTFMGKEIQYTNKDDKGSQMIITERPENNVLSSSTAALGQTNQKTVGDQLNRKFTSQHWEADPEVEGKLVFRGIDQNKIHYEIIFLINKGGEMTIQTIYQDGTELSDKSKAEKIKALFGDK